MFRNHRREWLAVWLWAALVAVVMLAPYLRRQADEWHNWRFSGILRNPGDDIATHLTFGRQARDGWFLFESKTAGADTRGHRFYNGLFLVMGLTARLTGLDMIHLYYLERTLAAMVVLVLAYWFAAQFFEERRMRWVALILASTSGGLEWLPEFLRHGTLGPPETEQIFTDTFWSLREEVVVGPATALLLVAVVLARRALLDGGGRRFFLLGLATLAAVSVHPHDVSTLCVVVGALAAFRWLSAGAVERPARLRRGIAVLAVIVGSAAPLVAYHAHVFLTDPAYQRYGLMQEIWLTPRWPVYYGVVLFAAMAGAAAILRRREGWRALLVIWPAVSAVVLASSFPPIQRTHFYYGLHIVLCVLATRGLWAGKRCQVLFLKKVPDTFFLAVFVAVASVTNVLDCAKELRPQVPASPIFHRSEEQEALTFLDANARESDIVACLAETRMRVPLLTGSRVYVGDGDLTPFYEFREGQMRLLMGREGPVEPMVVDGILKSARADYVYVESLARGMGAAYLERTLVAAGLAERVFANQWTAVYRVRKNETADGRR